MIRAIAVAIITLPNILRSIEAGRLLLIAAPPVIATAEPRRKSPATGRL
jgi:hypothetical protein